MKQLLKTRISENLIAKFPSLQALLRVLNFKLSDRAPPDKISLAGGGIWDRTICSIDTVGGPAAFDLTRLA